MAPDEHRAIHAVEELANLLCMAQDSIAVHRPDVGQGCAHHCVHQRCIKCNHARALFSMLILHISRCTPPPCLCALEFDYDGQHLATGDRGGRVVLFERVHPNVVRWPACICIHEQGP
eukprot:1149294-Pelagomonas_calceolata.AAC.4